MKYVTCASCGARMRSDRRWCLRCDERLVAAEPELSGFSFSGSRSLAFAFFGALLFIVPLVLYMPGLQLTNAKAQPLSKRLLRGAEQPSGNRTVVGPLSVAPPLPPPAVTSMTIAGPAAIGPASTAHDLQAAKVRLLRALKDTPNDPELLNDLGVVLLRLGQPDNAVSRFRRAADIAPGNWAYHFHLAYALGALKQWDGAVAEYRAAARLPGDEYATQCNLGMALHEKGDDKAAVQEFQKAVERAPAEAGVHLALGISLEKAGRLGDAQRQYSQYLQMAPAAPDAAKLKAHIQTLLTARAPIRDAPPTSSAS